MTQYLIGVDVGGTKTEACLLALEEGADFREHKVLARERISTREVRHVVKTSGGAISVSSLYDPQFDAEMRTELSSYLRRLNSLIDLVLSSPEAVKNKITRETILTLGIGLPGSIEPLTQRMVAGSIPFLSNVDLVKEFRKALAYEGHLIFDNDANCFALAETYLGAGKTWARENNLPAEHLCLLGVTLGTGVGGGIFVNGQLVRGRRGGAGEVGHMTLIEAGRPCYCGKQGCAEMYLSGPAFEYSYATRASAMEHVTGYEVFKRSLTGDPLATSVIDTYRDYLVTYLSNLANCLDPHVIVLGGGMSNQPRIYHGISERLSKECFLTQNPPAVVKNECGDSGGVLGAAMLGMWDILHGKKL
jgi:fructokinase